MPHKPVAILLLVILLTTPLYYATVKNAVTTVLLKVCSKLVSTTWNKMCEHNLLTACEQTKYNLFAGLLKRVLFCVCRSRNTH